MLTAYDGKDTASVDQFPKASARRRRISRSLRYQVAPNVNLTACASYALAKPYYSVFLPEFARAVAYKKKDVGLRLVDRLVFDESKNIIVIIIIRSRPAAAAAATITI